MHDRHAHAAPPQTARRLDPQQPAADHDRASDALARGRGSRARRRACGRRARRAGRVPRSGGSARLRAGREHELVVGERLAVAERCGARLEVERRHLAAREQPDSVRGKPRRRLQREPRLADAPAEQRARAATRSYGGSGSRPTIAISKRGIVREQPPRPSPSPAIPAPTTSRRRPASAAAASPPAAARSRAAGSTRTARRLQLRLAGDRVERAARRSPLSAPAAGSQVQRAPVERRERDARRRRGRSRARAGARRRGASAPARAPRPRRPAARASSGCSSTNGSGSAASSAADLPVRVIVCHCPATRPVVSTSGKSASGASAGSACGVGDEARAAVRGREAAVRVQPLRVPA